MKLLNVTYILIFFSIAYTDIQAASIHSNLEIKTTTYRQNKINNSSFRKLKSEYRQERRKVLQERLLLSLIKDKLVNFIQDGNIKPKNEEPKVRTGIGLSIGGIGIWLFSLLGNLSGLLFFGILIALSLSINGLVFGIKYLKENKKNPNNSKLRLSKFARILGIIGIVIFIAVMLIILGVFKI